MRRRRNGEFATHGPAEDVLTTGPTAHIEEYLLEHSTRYVTKLEEFAIDDWSRASKGVVAMLISPKTLLPVFVSTDGSDVFIHDVQKKYVLVNGYYGSENDPTGISCLRQHMMPGRKDLSAGAGGFGPLAYYGGALCSEVLGEGCTFSESGRRSSGADKAWSNFEVRGISTKETLDCEDEEEEVEHDERIDPDDYLPAYYEQNGWPEEMPDDPEDPESLVKKVEDRVRLHDLLPFFEDELPDALRYADDFDLTVGGRSTVNVTLTMTREDVSEPPDIKIKTTEYIRATGSEVQTREAECPEVDVMYAHKVRTRAGCVVWLNPQHPEQSFVPPDPTILAYMNPAAMSAGWFAQMLSACAEQSGDGNEYLWRFKAEALKAGAAARTPMMVGLHRAIGGLLPEPKAAPRNSGRRNGNLLRVIPRRAWLAQAAALADIGEE